MKYELNHRHVMHCDVQYRNVYRGTESILFDKGNIELKSRSPSLVLFKAIFSKTVNSVDNAMLTNAHFYSSFFPIELKLCCTERVSRWNNLHPRGCRVSNRL